jgi:hypothetical protein
MTSFTAQDPRSDLVSMAFEIVEMAREINELRAQVESLEWYRQEYFRVTEQTPENTQRMTGAIICAAMGNTEAAKEILNRWLHVHFINNIR